MEIHKKIMPIFLWVSIIFWKGENGATFQEKLNLKTYVPKMNLRILRAKYE